MTDIEKAMAGLGGHSVCLVRGDTMIVRDGKGISPLVLLTEENRDLRGFSAADLIVGRAAAMIFVLAGVSAVYGATMSIGAAEYLGKHGIPFSYGCLTEQIVNRRGDGICPMEKAVSGTGDPAEGLRLIKIALAELTDNSGSRLSTAVPENLKL